MSMRLRETVKQPDRYDSELFYRPTPNRALREAKRQRRPPYIDFDPTLPPAAFPTLDTPRVPAKTTKDGDSDERKASGMGNCEECPSRNGHNGAGGKDTETRVDFEDVPINLIDNYVASNGDFNPVYVKNMTRIAAAEKEFSIVDGGMEDSDTDEVMTSFPVQDPNWHDLSPRLQVEIFENLLESHSWSSVSHMLGLTDEECDQAREHFSGRNEQIVLENRLLERMREKQLRGLMRIDNSSRHKRVPHQLVFRNASKQYIHKLRDAIHTDYLLCHAGEIMNARRFLHKRGIDRGYAGTWSNSLAVLQIFEDDSEPETFEWTERLIEPCSSRANIAVSNSDQTLSAIPSSQRQLSTLTKRSVFNPIGRSGTVDPQQLILREGDMEAPPQRQSTYDIISQPFIPPSGMVQLRIGAEGAAQIRDSEHSCSTAGELLNVSPTPGSFYGSPPSCRVIDGTSSTEISPSLPSGGSFSLNVRRALSKTIGRQWSNGPAENNSRSFATSSMRLKQRLEEVRQESQRERAEREINKASSNANAISPIFQPRQSPITPKIESRLTPPGRIMFPSDPEEPDAGEDSILPFETTEGSRDMSIMETPASAFVVYDSDEWTALSPTTVSSFSLNEPTQSIASAVGLINSPENWCSEEEDEGEGEEDEMVLVPAVMIKQGNARD
ncbi:hypothetical protein MW887_008308 [Aspergillus wentii]|nr:hypothetical protein MW887_008308 [Aspergillus wentii]